GTKPPAVLGTFPTRRSSDLRKRVVIAHQRQGHAEKRQLASACRIVQLGNVLRQLLQFQESWNRHRLFGLLVNHHGSADTAVGMRSEEHTSELQSLRHLVCRL